MIRLNYNCLSGFEWFLRFATQDCSFNRQVEMKSFFHHSFYLWEANLSYFIVFSPHNYDKNSSKILFAALALHMYSSGIHSVCAQESSTVYAEKGYLTLIKNLRQSR